MPVLLAAGVLGSPHLLLASGLERLNPGGRVVGRYLLRHCNAMLFGLFVPSPNPTGDFHKQFGVNDYYFGHPDVDEPRGKLGCIQQVMPPSAALVTNRLPRSLAVLDQPLRRPVGEMMRFTTGLLVIAEDQPRAENHVALSGRRRNRYGQPQLSVTHRYSRRDEAARTALAREAARVLKAAGAKYIVRRDLDTFSHAVGTVRMGADPATSALDEFGAFRGVDNLHVLDGSVMPTAAGVNPTLTIAANALRGAGQIVRTGG
jgi:choline dehydrogenase-like flavoprotein